MNNEKHSGNPIVKIEVDKLFGSYTYSLPDPKKQLDISRLGILYGSNGTGKTTILQLIYHMLHPERRGNHRTFIAGQLFHRFSVGLSNGLCFNAERAGNKMCGSFLWSVSKGNRTITDVYLEADENNFIPGKSPDEDIEKKVRKMIKHLEKMSVQLYFLSDDRKLLGVDEDDTEYEYSTESQSIYERDVQIRTRRVRDKSRGLPLEKTLSNLMDWIQSQVLRGSSIGDTNVNTIYSQVISQIAKSEPSDTISDAGQMQSLKSTLNELAIHSQEFTKLGFIPSFTISDISSSIANPSPETANIIVKVLKPYVDSMSAKFNALEELKDLINLYLKHLNDFYIDKKVIFNLQDRLLIKSASGHTLQPHLLSSGEKQLLLILSYVLMSNETPSIVIIDEPEISLNVKWQRKLIEALLECMRNNPIQLLMASHSIELINQYKNNVMNLGGGRKKT